MFADIKRATDRGLNKHRTVVSEEEGKKKRRKKKKRRRRKRGREKNTSGIIYAQLYSVICDFNKSFLFFVLRENFEDESLTCVAV